MVRFPCFYGWIIFYCIYILQLLYLFIHWPMLRLSLCLSCCKWCCNEHGSADISLRQWFFFPSDIYPAAKLVSHIVVLLLTFWGMAILFLSWLQQLTLPPIVCNGSLFSASLPNLLFLIFLIIANLTDGRCYLIVVLVCISLLMNDVEYLFMLLLPFVFFGKMSIPVLCPYFNYIICVFVIDLYEFLRHFRYNLLSDIWFAIFSHFVGSLSILFFSFAIQGFLVWPRPINLFLLLLLVLLVS